MTRSLSTAARRSAYAPQTSEAWLLLLTITHESLVAPLRFVNDKVTITSNSQSFMGFPFAVELPQESNDAPGEARITIDNVDRSIVTAVRAMATPPEVTIQIIMASQPNTIEVEYGAMTLRDVKWDVASVSGTLRHEDISTEPVTVQMTPQRFPAMF